MINITMIATTALITILSVIGCEEQKENVEEIGVRTDARVISTITPEKETGEESVLAHYQLSSDDPTIVDLPSQLKELSGLAIAPDGRLFGHNDEEGVVYQISLRSGELPTWFTVGAITLSEDLEGIAIVNGRFYLTNSNGDIFEFPEGPNEGSVDFVQHRTELSGKFDVEGLCYDPGTNSLLMACKEYPGGGLDDKDFRSIYSFSLGSHKIDPEPRFVLSVKDLEDHLDLKKFRPSAIERHAETGHFIVLSGNDPAIIELSATGEIIAAMALPKSIHPQPEGITFGPDGELLIGNEGGELIRYERQP